MGTMNGVRYLPKKPTYRSWSSSAGKREVEDMVKDLKGVEVNVRENGRIAPHDVAAGDNVERS